MSDVTNSLIANREPNEYEITIQNLYKIIHIYTERIMINVVTDCEALKDRVSEYYLTTDLSGDESETQRILKYYGNVPVWNLHVKFIDCKRLPGVKRVTGCGIIGAIVANCYYRDVKPYRLIEVKDIKNAKQREYYRKRNNNGERT